MFVALNLSTNTAIAGIDIANHEKDQIPHQHDTGSYQCLFCGAPLEFSGDLTQRYHYFTHTNQGDCINDGNISRFHRLGQEIVAKELFNWLSRTHELAQIEFERQIGSESDFVIADLCVLKPIQIVIEIVYLSEEISLRRRLRTLFGEGYAVSLVILANAKISPSRIEHHMQKIAAIKVGRFNPYSLDLEFGSVLTSDEVDPDSSVWENIPAYLS